ncbi:UNVERIFIED_CONTAM: hypothetical protein Sradi_2664700 [Sesamum radiatum]|uniref:Uncharacterized protein n=1 Tax=Sesamum radiatum TaxID=300843 RepID=A0AAW2S6S8_SESRA
MSSGGPPLLGRGQCGRGRGRGRGPSVPPSSSDASHIGKQCFDHSHHLTQLDLQPTHRV